MGLWNTTSCVQSVYVYTFWWLIESFYWLNSNFLATFSRSFRFPLRLHEIKSDTLQTFAKFGAPCQFKNNWRRRTYVLSVEPFPLFWTSGDTRRSGKPCTCPWFSLISHLTIKDFATYHPIHYLFVTKKTDTSRKWQWWRTWKQWTQGTRESGCTGCSTSLYRHRHAERTT